MNVRDMLEKRGAAPQQGMRMPPETETTAVPPEDVLETATSPANIPVDLDVPVKRKRGRPRKAQVTSKATGRYRLAVAVPDDVRTAMRLRIAFNPDETITSIVNHALQRELADQIAAVRQQKEREHGTS